MIAKNKLNGLWFFIRINCQCVHFVIELTNWRCLTGAVLTDSSIGPDSILSFNFEFVLALELV